MATAGLVALAVQVDSVVLKTFSAIFSVALAEELVKGKLKPRAKTSPLN